MLVWMMSRVALATCWGPLGSCPFTFHRPDGATMEEPWPSSAPLRVSGRCVVGGCAAGGEPSAVFYGGPPAVVHLVAEDGALVAVLAAFRVVSSDLLELDHRLVPGRYVYGDVSFDVVGEVPEEARLDWPPGLPFPPDGVHVPISADSGEIERDVVSLTDLRDRASAAGWRVEAESLERLWLSDDTHWITAQYLSATSASVHIRLSWTKTWWSEPDPCPDGGTLARDERTVRCLREGVRHGPLTERGPGFVYEEGDCVDDLREGPWILFDASGARTSTHYRRGLREGEATTAHPNRVIAEVVSWSAGRREGPAQRWWADGSPRDEGAYCAGERCGPWSAWYPRGVGYPHSPSGLGTAEVQLSADQRGEAPLAISPEGHLLERANYSAGQLEGPYESWFLEPYTDTWSVLRGRYEGGRPDGRFTWTAETSRWRESWRHGVRHGIEKQWSPPPYLVISRSRWRNGTEVMVSRRGGDHLMHRTRLHQ